MGNYFFYQDDVILQDERFNPKLRAIFIVLLSLTYWPIFQRLKNHNYFRPFFTVFGRIE
jgi:hypothetical protein